MELIVNGERMRFEGPLALSELIESLGLEERKLAVERNLGIVPKSAYRETKLVNGDRLEIVHFVGGG